MRARWAAGTAASVSLLVALTAGCAHHTGTPAEAASSSTGTTGTTGTAGTAGTGASSAPAPGATPSGYADMEKKVDAAESAAAAADKDATSDADR
ncbi:hypothetical protein [Streptomyces anandii]|uniref:hypothetical protein n=1 Tax=Streptomyces anandii TaxID=285454 RepID=UPI001671D31D|nr:hypothetical protein [Streptomyces anandii]GGX84803.1 hypothetical protein GCM10010510_32380 [Streptomyces anandii JCM 4720]